MNYKQTILFASKDQSGILKAVGEKNRYKASFHLKKVIYKRNLAIVIVLLMLLYSIRNYEKWTAISPAELNGLRFFAFILSLIALIAGVVHLVMQFKRIQMLKQMIRSIQD